MSPELARRLKESKELDDGIFVYRLTKGGYVWRKWLPHFNAEGWRPKKQLDPSYGTVGKNKSKAVRHIIFKMNNKGALDKVLA